jgi:putative transposase
MYLAIVKDLYDKEIVGWSLDTHMRTDLCIAALEAAVKKRRPKAGLIHHSDRGSQYCSNAYQEKLRKYRMTCSMSRKGNCWDNACAETFFSTLKSERIRHQKYQDKEALRRDLFWYIEYFYNRHRRHLALDNLTIPQFQNRQAHQIAA